MNSRDVPIAFYDGKVLPAHAVAIPFWDLGWSQGVSIVEQLRTYAGRLPLKTWHWQRMRRGLSQLELDADGLLAEVDQNVELVVARNWAMLPSSADLGVCVVVSGGSVDRFIPPGVDLEQARRPKILVHTFPLQFSAWREEFANGVKLVSSSIRAIPHACVPTEFKHRSRLNYFLAQQDVRRRSPSCRPLLQTLDGHLADAPTAGILVFDPQTGWVAPRREDALQSVSVEIVEELARRAGVEFTRRAMTIDEIAAASEGMWCSSPCGLLAVVEVDGRAIGSGEPGPQYSRMAERWSEFVGCDYRGQALRA